MYVYVIITIVVHVYVEIVTLMVFFMTLFWVCVLVLFKNLCQTFKKSSAEATFTILTCK